MWNQIIHNVDAIKTTYYSLCKYSVRSTTGYNLRKKEISQLEHFSIDDIEYHPASVEEKWKISIINEVIDIKFGSLNIEGFSVDELDEICGHLCVS